MLNVFDIPILSFVLTISELIKSHFTNMIWYLPNWCYNIYFCFAFKIVIDISIFIDIRSDGAICLCTLFLGSLLRLREHLIRLLVIQGSHIIRTAGITINSTVDGRIHKLLAIIGYIHIVNQGCTCMEHACGFCYRR